MKKPFIRRFVVRSVAIHTLGRRKKRTKESRWSWKEIFCDAFSDQRKIIRRANTKLDRITRNLGKGIHRIQTLFRKKNELTGTRMEIESRNKGCTEVKTRSSGRRKGRIDESDQNFHILGTDNSQEKSANDREEWM